MTSDYLEREIRGRLVIARDMALAGNRDWETISTIADGLDVMFAVTAVDCDRGMPVFLHVSNHCWPMTGFWPNELEGRNPTALQCRETNTVEIRRFMEELRETGESETRVVNVRKNGDPFGCRILACRSARDSTADRPVYFAFMNECSLGECL